MSFTKTVMNKKKVFLRFPEYPGGKEELKKYIRNNLKYPKEAIDNQISGVVIVKAEINDNGQVLSTDIIKGLGYGCDEEASRLIQNIEFGSVKNRGKRVKITKRFSITFNLPPQKSVSYHVVGSKENSQNKNRNTKYSYNIIVKNNQKE